MPVWTCPHKVRILTSTMMRNTNLGPALDAFVHPQKHCRTFFLVCVCVHGSVVTHGGTRSQPHTSSCRRHMIEGPYKFGCSPKQGKTTPVVCIFKRPLLCLFFFFYIVYQVNNTYPARLGIASTSASWATPGPGQPPSAITPVVCAPTLDPKCGKTWDNNDRWP